MLKKIKEHDKIPTTESSQTESTPGCVRYKKETRSFKLMFDNG